MGIDIKIPIGLMFTLLGLLLSIFGFATSSDTELYAKSLNHNINIIAGLLMLAFGVIMLILAKVKNQK
ncbi:MAG: hypothetical protein KA792_00685 [Bacteroidales bacterium]|nr:hypothetical protein [Bacteroidales bacterium]